MKIAIIGGSGKMGQWLTLQLLKENIEVVITGRNQEKLLAAGNELNVPVASNIEAVEQADIIILSVPIDTFESVASQIAPKIRQDQIIIDITSLKSRPVEIMHHYFKKGQILGAHPIFGPGAKSVANQNFILTPTNEGETVLAGKVKRYLDDRGANVSIMSPREHDHLMSVVLGLAHFIAIVSADTLLSFDNFQEMKKIGGTTFKVLYTLIESVICEDPELYAVLQMNFPDIQQIEELFQSNTKTWADMIRGNDRQGFVQKMYTLREKLEKTDPEFHHAYENMYKITDNL